MKNYSNIFKKEHISVVFSNAVIFQLICLNILILLPYSQAYSPAPDTEYILSAMPLVSPNGRIFAVQNGVGYVDIYNTSDLKKVSTINGTLGPRSFFLDDSKTIISCGYQNIFFMNNNTIHYNIYLPNTGYKLDSCTQFNSSSLLFYGNSITDYYNQSLFQIDILTGAVNGLNISLGDLNEIGLIRNNELVYSNSGLLSYNFSTTNRTILISPQVHHFISYDNWIYYSSSHTYSNEWYINRYDIHNKKSTEVIKLPHNTGSRFSISEDGRYISYLESNSDNRYGIVYDINNKTTIFKVKYPPMSYDSDYVDYMCCIFYGFPLLLIIGILFVVFRHFYSSGKVPIDKPLTKEEIKDRRINLIPGYIVFTLGVIFTSIVFIMFIVNQHYDDFFCLFPGVILLLIGSAVIIRYRVPKQR